MIAPYWTDGRLSVYHGDCLDIMSELGDRTVDVVLTDPSYSSGGRRENARSIRKSMIRSVSDDDWIHGDGMSTQGFVYLMRQCGVQWRYLLVPGGHVLSFIDWRMAAHLSAALESADLRQHPTLVWDKMTLGMGAIFRNQHEFIVHLSAGNPNRPQRRDVANVLRFPAIRDGVHPTEKPVPLLRALLSVVTPPGGIVLDAFAGSGSTLVAARELGLRAIGIESDERWCKEMVKRLDQDILFTTPHEVGAEDD